MILSPSGKRRHRMIVLGQKRLPDVHDTGDRTWAYVHLVTREPREIEEEFARQTYTPKTRGERVLPAARPAGEGVLEERFRGRRFAELDPPELLDYEGAELVLIDADEDVSDELGIRLNTERETANRADIFTQPNWTSTNTRRSRYSRESGGEPGVSSPLTSRR
jgi:hypothetical protein